MGEHSLFLSVVFTVRNQSDQLEALLQTATEVLSNLVSVWEVIIVDNASNDESVRRLKDLTNEDRLPNIQVYALTKEVDPDTAAWVGVENALGDYVAVVDPEIDDLNFLPSMLSEAMTGVDIVSANNLNKPKQNLSYRVANAGFNRFYRLLTGVDLAKEAPRYRLLSRTVINFILQHPKPSLTYRHLPATGGFTRSNLEYESKSTSQTPKSLGESIDRGMRILVSTTRAPIRLVTILCLGGAVANVIYSAYVVGVVLLKDSVEQGWASLSLQISGMFFLISLVLLVLGEYILHMASLSNAGPSHHVAKEFNSKRITRRQKLNIEETYGDSHPHSIAKGS